MGFGGRESSRALLPTSPPLQMEMLSKANVHKIINKCQAGRIAEGCWPMCRKESWLINKAQLAHQTLMYPRRHSRKRVPTRLPCKGEKEGSRPPHQPPELSPQAQRVALPQWSEVLPLLFQGSLCGTARQGTSRGNPGEPKN